MRTMAKLEVSRDRKMSVARDVSPIQLRNDYEDTLRNMSGSSYCIDRLALSLTIAYGYVSLARRSDKDLFFSGINGPIVVGLSANSTGDRRIKEKEI